MPVLDLLQACAGKHLFADRYLSLHFALPPHRLLVKKVSTKPAVMPCCPFSHESLRWPYESPDGKSKITIMPTGYTWNSCTEV